MTTPIQKADLERAREFRLKLSFEGGKYMSCYNGDFDTAFAQALSDQRERDAKIAEEMFKDQVGGIHIAGERIAEAIRKGDSK